MQTKLPEARNKSLGRILETQIRSTTTPPDRPETMAQLTTQLTVRLVQTPPGTVEQSSSAGVPAAELGDVAEPGALGAAAAAPFDRTESCLSFAFFLPMFSSRRTARTKHRYQAAKVVPQKNKTKNNRAESLPIVGGWYTATAPHSEICSRAEQRAKKGRKKNSGLAQQSTSRI